MPDPKKKKYSTTPSGQTKVFTVKKVKSDPDKVMSKKKTSGGIRGIKTKAQKITDKDGRMQAARDDARKKEVKKAGGTKAYLDKAKKTKSGLIKYKDRYVRKSSAAGKAALKKRKK